MSIARLLTARSASSPGWSIGRAGSGLSRPLDSDAAEHLVARAQAVGWPADRHP